MVRFGEPLAEGAVHHVAPLEVRALEQSRRHDDLAEPPLEVPVGTEHRVVQRALAELAGGRVAVDPAVADVADQRRRRTVAAVADLDHRGRRQPVIEGRGDQRSRRRPRRGQGTPARSAQSSPGP